MPLLTKKDDKLYEKYGVSLTRTYSISFFSWHNLATFPKYLMLIPRECMTSVKAIPSIGEDVRLEKSSTIFGTIVLERKTAMSSINDLSSLSSSLYRIAR